jgi:SAM-dependent methyltransferase
MTTDADAERQRLLQANIIHDFDATLAARNLRGAYGAVQRRRYQDLLRFVEGRRLLDAGCGLGLLAKVCLDAGYVVTAIDLDDRSLELAARLHSVRASRTSVYATGLPAGSIDTALLFDVIEHLDFPPLLAELTRLGCRRVLVFDSNLRNPALRAYRHRAGHEEHQEYRPEDVIAGFAGGGFTVSSFSYQDTIALPLTGGLQRKALPVLGRFPELVYHADRAVTWAARLARLAHLTAFRYLLVFDGPATSTATGGPTADRDTAPSRSAR